MRLIFLLFTVATSVVIALFVLLYFLWFHEGVVDTDQYINLSIVTTDDTLPSQSPTVRTIFSDDVSEEMETLISTHLDKEVYAISQCATDPQKLYLELAFEFHEGSDGIFTTEFGEEYLKDNYRFIAPYLLETMHANVDIESVVAIPFTMFDADQLIYRGSLVTDQGDVSLFHTWIGNAVYFSTSLSCLEDQLETFYHGH